MSLISTRVTQYIEDLIKREGGYVNHPNDRGGPTNWGITQQVARAYGYSGDMRNLPRAKAEEIYRQQYWIEPGFSKVGVVMPKLAEELFDTGVNMGPKRAGKFLQRALNALNRRADSYPDIGVDGDIGRMTIFALEGLVKARGVDNSQKVLLRMVDAQQAVKYIEIAEANPTQEDFMYGWILNRVGV